MQTRRAVDRGVPPRARGSTSPPRLGRYTFDGRTVLQRGASPRERTGNRDEQACADDRHDDRVDHAAVARETDRRDDPSADHGADDPQDDVHERAVARSPHDSPRRPAGDQAYDDPPHDVHGLAPAGSWLPAHQRMTRSTGVPESGIYTLPGIALGHGALGAREAEAHQSH